jgi:glycine/D-amino acid oxidase-like deaminating enzyme
MEDSVSRRRLLTGVGAACLAGALEGCTIEFWGPKPAPPAPPPLHLAPITATPDRITAITVCTRPFRAQGPRLDVEQIAGKTVVHNYGHGGSGWSLSWGSSTIAVQKALATGERSIGVIGCGALGMTSALLAQRAGVRVTIYAKELPPNVRSSLASGLWTPDSRICFEDYATPEFKQQWQAMARESFKTYQTMLGLPGIPVEFIDNYWVFDESNMERRRQTPGDTRPPFAELQRELIPDLIPHSEDFPPGTHPLGSHYLRRNTQMMFNLTSYTQMLLAEFRSAGGQIEIKELHAPNELGSLRERTLINATGYGARALFGDQSIVPVRGQLARMIPQPDVNYGLLYRDVSFVPRRDGLVFQVIGDDDYYGYNDATTTPERSEAEHAVNTVATLFK